MTNTVKTAGATAHTRNESRDKRRSNQITLRLDERMSEAKMNFHVATRVAMQSFSTDRTGMDIFIDAAIGFFDFEVWILSATYCRYFRVRAIASTVQRPALIDDSRW